VEQGHLGAGALGCPAWGCCGWRMYGGGGVFVLCVVQPSTTSHQQRQRQSIEQLVSGVGGVFWLKAADVLLRAACMPVSY
jgi:hypothetical protein